MDKDMSLPSAGRASTEAIMRSLPSAEKSAISEAHPISPVSPGERCFAVEQPSTEVESPSALGRLYHRSDAGSPHTVRVPQCAALDRVASCERISIGSLPSARSWCLSCQPEEPAHSLHTPARKVECYVTTGGVSCTGDNVDASSAPCISPKSGVAWVAFVGNVYW